MEEIRRHLYDHESRISRLESWRNEVRSRHSNTPAWVFGILGTVMSGAWMLLTLYLAGGAP